MKNKEKIKRLSKEIDELEKKKAEKEKVKELFAKRNQLKFPLIYKTGSAIKSGWNKMGEWADKKNNQMEEEMKQKDQDKAEDKKKAEEPETEIFTDDELYEQMFGKGDLAENMKLKW